MADIPEALIENASLLGSISLSSKVEGNVYFVVGKMVLGTIADRLDFDRRLAIRID